MTPDEDKGSGTRPENVVPLFQIRESLFTTATRDPVNQSTYGLFVSCQLILVILTIVHYILVPSLAKQDMDILISTFSRIHVSLAIEVLYLVLCSLLVIIVRMRMQSHAFCARFVYGATVTVIFAVVVLLPVYLILTCDPGVAIRVAMTLNQIRIIMKLISFLVENRTSFERNKNSGYSRIISQDKKSNPHSGNTGDAENVLPTQKSMLYFLFAPTLIYQHSYPRSHNSTNWKMVFLYLIQWSCVFVPGLIVTRNMMPVLEKIGHEDMAPDSLMILVFNATCGAFIAYIGIGYVFLHCWCNMWAEILRFGDRGFYDDWWNARDDHEFLKKWNKVTKDWLMRYIYSPCVKKNRMLAPLAVNLASAVVHDYVFSLMIGGFFPLATLTGMCGGLPASVIKMMRPGAGPLVKQRRTKRPKSGTHLPLFLFSAMMAPLFAIFMAFEGPSRRNCPLATDASFTQLLIPRMFSCVSFHL